MPAEGESGGERNFLCRWLAAHDNVVTYWPLALALLVLWLATGLMVANSMKHQGAWTYSRDDAYIQMAVARNLVEHGSWGINAGEYNSASSSPLWALMVSATYLVFGVNDYSPAIMNLLFVTLVVAAVFFILKQQGLSPPYNFLVLLAVILFAPLPALIHLGMEHSVQILLAILFFYYASLVFGLGRKGSLDRPAIWLLAIAPFLVFIRYEGLFLVAVVCLLLLFKRRWLLTAALAALGALPVVVFGLFSVAAGGGFLPNPMTLKSRIPFFPIPEWIKTNITHLHDPLVRVAETPLWLILCTATTVILVLTFVRRDLIRRDVGFVRGMNIIFLAVVYIHLQTNNSLHFRYDAYLVILGILAVSIPLFSYLQSVRLPAGAGRKVVLVLVGLGVLALAVLPFVQRGWVKMRVAPQETRRVFEQHYQMSEFLDRYYTGKVVAANDIGAINYYADIETVDLWGLGDNDVAKRRIEIRKETPQVGEATDTKRDLFVLSTAEIDEITSDRGTHIALVYDDIYEVGEGFGIPDDWVLVGRWLVYRYERDLYDEVSFYAVDPAEEADLMRNMQEFSGELPCHVKQEGVYTEGLAP